MSLFRLTCVHEVCGQNSVQNVVCSSRICFDSEKADGG